MKSQEKPITKTKGKRMPAARLVWSVVGLFFIFILYVGYQRVMQPDVNPADYSFFLNKIKITGVPNSVVLSYDATNSPSDSVFIVQTWEISRKTLVPIHRAGKSQICYDP